MSIGRHAGQFGPRGVPRGLLDQQRSRNGGDPDGVGRSSFESSGIITFITGPGRDMYQGLGAEMAHIAASMTIFDPDLAVHPLPVRNHYYCGFLVTRTAVTPDRPSTELAGGVIMAPSKPAGGQCSSNTLPLRVRSWLRNITREPS
jgi:hypothetical protein